MIQLKCPEIVLLRQKLHMICMLSVDPEVKRKMTNIFLTKFKENDCFVRLKNKLMSEAVKHLS